MNDAFIITLAYPETIVTHAEEWYSPFLRFLFVGNKTHVRAGHAALVLIDKSTGVLEYFDFGRYTTSLGHGRVRGRDTDFELHIPIVPQIENNQIANLDDILKFLASHPKLTHGEGNLYASVCNAIDYQKAKQYITTIQNQGFIRYAAFIKNASNCSRFVTDTLITSVTDASIKSNLIKSKWFTPSTIGNVVLSDTENHVYIVSESRQISKFNSTVRKENRRLFLDVLKGYIPNVVGSLEPKHNTIIKNHAQWLSGIGSGAWFELYDLNHQTEFRFRRISPYGNIDCDGIYMIDSEGFDISTNYEFIHYSNCQYFHIMQNNATYRFKFLKKYND
ncbi:DUF6695 family protein [Psychroserpens ponticola]|uniref:Uncharacterized protein n=1 Tax=Psychroserpens ponticola TaxID=2932268 RepID=A0ABY7RVY6_9FLAO|nr:DUF6695 family protein [Psychroserpens ponticola]WCO01099.1 hypothetical protein MUN68_013625 [Psychroserpens ponticola]